MAPANEAANSLAIDSTADGDDKTGNGSTVKDDQDAKSTTCDSPEQQQYMTGIPFFITFGSLMLAALLAALNASTVATAIPSITNSFHSIQDVGWYSSSYLISK